MKTKLIASNSKDLIIFLSGWGCDDVQFKSMPNNKNLLICWDYADLNFNFDFTLYNNVYLIAYSAGVFIAGLIEHNLPKIKKSIAINGNPKIFDEYFGILPNALNIMQNLDLSNYMDFRKKYLVFDEKDFEYFNQNASIRTFESCDNELNKLIEYYKSNNSEYEFDKAILSDNDKIFEPKHQMEYFKDKYILLKNSAHHVFSKFKSFDEILDKA